MRSKELLDTTFSALADPKRRAIVARLAQGETALSKLAEPFDISQTAVTKHVQALSAAGIVVVEKRGRTRHCRLQTSTMKQAFDWLGFYQSFWETQMSSLADHLTEKSPEKLS